MSQEHTEGALDAFESVAARYRDAIDALVGGATVTITIDGTDTHLSLPNTHRGVMIGILDDHRAMIEYGVASARQAA